MHRAIAGHIADPWHPHGATTERSPSPALTCGHRVPWPPHTGLGPCSTLTGTKLFP